MVEVMPVILADAHRGCSEPRRVLAPFRNLWGPSRRLGQCSRGLCRKHD
jgi:hypothetical protein